MFQFQDTFQPDIFETGQQPEEEIQPGANTDSPFSPGSSEVSETISKLEEVASLLNDGKDFSPRLTETRPGTPGFVQAKFT